MEKEEYFKELQKKVKKRLKELEKEPFVEYSSLRELRKIRRKMAKMPREEFLRMLFEEDEDFDDIEVVEFRRTKKPIIAQLIEKNPDITFEELKRELEKWEVKKEEVKVSGSLSKK